MQGDTRTVRKECERGGVTFRRCQQCLSWVQSPEITVQSAAEWYDSIEYREGGSCDEGAYLDYFADESCRQAEAEMRCDLHIKNKINIENSKVLEVGCATGSLLSVLKRRGGTVLGIDLSPAFVEWGRKVNQLEIELGDYLNFDFASSDYDAIIMLGAISNMHDIGNVLKKTNELLKPEGIFYFNFPMATSLTAKLYGNRYWMFAPSVLNFMSEEGCRKALRNAGFKVIEIAHDRQKPSLSKLLGHAKLPAVYRLLKKLGMGNITMPISFPIPGVMAGTAQKG